MGISQGLEIGLKARKMRLQDVNVPLAQSSKSMIKNGKRKLPKDLAPAFAKAIDHPAVSMAIANEYSGGFGSMWLDGANVDLHRSAVKERALRELQEAHDALDKFCSANPPEMMTDSDGRQLKNLLMELLDARQWVDQTTAVYCEVYGLDFLGVNAEHHQRLRSMRLVTN